MWIVSAAANDTYEVYVDGAADETYTNTNLVCTAELGIINTVNPKNINKTYISMYNNKNNNNNKK